MAKIILVLFGIMACWGFTTSRTIRRSRQSSPASQTLWFNTGGDDFEQDNQHNKMSPVLMSNDVSRIDINSNIRYKEPTYNKDTGNSYGNAATTYTKTVQPTYPVQTAYVKPVQTTYPQPVQTTYVKPVQPTYPQAVVQKQYGYQTGNNNYGGDGFSLFDLFED